ncbi:hypothetical protein Pmani_012238 [Petrolisthes manimaculis]|uniref:Uncharacterized protein n=1 Tax=Petrolisthes manimaculis TaxID=1843537 RepID=A0AAE1PXH4_9EUCA|nr:hypothetical protein Pmani_015174 [Petrolisthes manimaculis]KAK4316620.1 hypothetical protein Pmani_012238 [Petrolisthes manimaculis]
MEDLALDQILEWARAVIIVNSPLRPSEASFGVTEQTSAKFCATAECCAEESTICAADDKDNLKATCNLVTDSQMAAWKWTDGKELCARKNLAEVDPM